MSHPNPYLFHIGWLV